MTDRASGEIANTNSPAVRSRVLVALAIGLFAGAAAWVASHRPGFGTPDFQWWWLTARALLDGGNPYAIIPEVLGPQFQFFNPLPAAVVAIPFALLRPDVGLALFSGLSAAILAFVVTRRSYDPLVMFLSASFAHTVVMGQWSLLLTAALFAPSLAFLGSTKPNIGVAIVAALASWRAAAAMLAFAALTLVFRPSWPMEWLAVVRASTWHFSPLGIPGGVLLLLALVRWRRPEARLVATLGLLPQSPFVYEAMPLFFVPRSRPEFYALVIGSDLALGIYAYFRSLPMADYLRVNGIAVVACMYLPALVMVLRRPNEGSVPAWLERAAAYLPARLRGQAVGEELGRQL
jgi:hypothetical protein